MKADKDRPAPPPGFVPSPERGPFTTHNGPVFHDPAAEGARQAFFALSRHCNGVGLVHGGMLAAFLDGLLASAAGKATGAIPVTVHLSIDFLDMGRAGDWVVGEARIDRAARELAFASGQVYVAGRQLARATGVFKLMHRRGG